MKIGSKTISVTEEVYDLLSKMKFPGESFSDTIRRLCKTKTTSGLKEWMKSTEGWSDLSEDEVEELDRTIASVRKSSSAQEADPEEILRGIVKESYSEETNEKTAKEWATKHAGR